MGNGIFCSEVCDKRKRFQKERGNHEIIFLDTQPKGVLTPETAKYLTSQELAIFKASSFGNLALLKQLLGVSNPKIFDINRTSLLHVACRSGSVEVVEELAKRGYEVNIGDINGETPLHIAVGFKREKVVAKLVELGGNPFIKNRQGKIVYQLLSNQPLKRMMTTEIEEDSLSIQNNLDGKGVSPQKCHGQDKIKRVLKKQRYGDVGQGCMMEAMREKYDLSRGKHIQKEMVIQSAESTKGILERRLEVLKLSVEGKSQTKLEKGGYGLNKRLFNLLARHNPKLAMVYFLCSREDEVLLLLHNIDAKYQRLSLQLLTNLVIYDSSEIVLKFFKTLLKKQDKIINIIQLLEQHICFEGTLLSIHILCWLVSIARYDGQDISIQQTDAFHTVLYMLISAPFHIDRTQPASYQQLQELLVVYSPVLKLSMLEGLEMTQLFQSRTIRKSSPKGVTDSGTSATMMGKQGRLWQIAGEGILFMFEHEVFVFTELSDGEYQGIQVKQTGAKEVDKRFRFSASPDILIT